MNDTSLNLLPPAHKEDIRSAALLLRMQTLGIVACITAIVIAGAITVTAVLVRGISDDFAARSSSSSREYDGMMTEVRAINGYIRKVEALQPIANWSEIMLAITELAPAEVRLSSIRGEADGTIHVIGTATTRDAMLSMRAALEGSPLFEQVDSPLSNLLQQKDVSFEFVLKHGELAAAAKAKAPAVKKK